MLMNFHDLGRYRRARVWLDEPPFAPYPVRERIERAFPLINYTCKKHSILTVELVLAARMVSNYACIGITYFPSDSGELVVQAGIGYSDDAIIKDVIAIQPEVVRRGIPKEYIVAMFDEIHTVTKDSAFLLPSGTIAIHTGAHGEIGSSVISFRQTINVLLRLLTLESKTHLSVQDTVMTALDRMN
ncbi:hypothetical protein R70723_21875 [Paenibacillus sp. FSL R7-0273]|uniref:hypothetical protein n=1 Tax=Paenibacillus sp. FSL R7-0273 TaxID=1536772 RepID=UPI0004F64A80|nr:hypothetical protein [Paenibacillus sp. FSL R7-0273]AIQ48265.1 hypothetical protein R70723_21875 [Paenibacillus sp. FSL R7-0273]OMF92032.1 hypothetical protein BK144_14925 [Paenibacillus sp. FSL R7-0273]